MKKDNNLNSRSLLFFFLRAFAFSLFINLPALCGMWLHSGYSPAGFSDWDEAYYLQSAMDYGMRAASYLFSFEAKPPLLGDLLGDFYYPHNVTDLLIGLPAYLFLGFPATKLGLILDVICSFLAYITWSAFFGLFTRSRLYSETGAIASLAVPWLFSLDGYGIFGNLQIGSFLYQPIGNYPCVPVLRGVYTQVSYPLFALACYYFKRAVDCTEHHSRQFAAYAGLLAGLLIYVYFYA